MSNEHLPIDYLWAGHGWAQRIRDALEQIGRHPAAQAFAARLSDAMIYIVAAMVVFILAIDGYVLVRTM
jgi:cytochrome b subunit of formate dehydrogenase